MSERDEKRLDPNLALSTAGQTVPVNTHDNQDTASVPTAVRPNGLSFPVTVFEDVGVEQKPAISRPKKARRVIKSAPEHSEKKKVSTRLNVNDREEKRLDPNSALLSTPAQMAAVDTHDNQDTAASVPTAVLPNGQSKVPTVFETVGVELKPAVSKPKKPKHVMKTAPEHSDKKIKKEFRKAASHSVNPTDRSAKTRQGRSKQAIHNKS